MTGPTTDDLHRRVSDLEDWRDEEASPLLEKLQQSIGELRVRVGQTATKEDIVQVHQAINRSNENLTTALRSVPPGERNVTWIVGILGSVAMVIAAIAAFYR